MIKTIKEVKTEFLNANIKDIQNLINIYENDERIGIKNIIKIYKNKLIKYKKEILNLENMKIYEKEAYNKGKNIIGGIDEVGRGAFAGPVVTACVVLPKDFYILGINDSKKLSKEKREKFFRIIHQNAIDISINMEHNNVIDKINILQATKKCMLKNIENLKNKPDYLILDSININTSIPYISIVKADEKSVSVAAASIIAKVTRDKYMENMHNIYPNYKFNLNKGYGTKEHIQALKKYGFCSIHRKSFIKKYV